MERKISIRIIIAAVLWLLVILWMFFIFSMSAENSEESGKTSGKVVDKIAGIIVPGYKEMTDAEKENVRDSLSLPIRKLAHFTEYAVFGTLLSGAVTLTGRKISLSPLKAAFSLAGGWLYALTDEFHQSFVPGRGPALKDVLIDGAGATCGFLFVLLLFCIFKRKMQKRKND